MQNIKPVQVQLEIIIHENGLNTAIATLANAVKEVIMDETLANAVKGVIMDESEIGEFTERHFPTQGLGKE